MFRKRYHALAFESDKQQERLLTHLDHFRTRDLDGRILFGGRQAWYPSAYQRQRGCGPTTAANMLAYLAHRPGFVSLYPPYLEASRAQYNIQDEHVFAQAGYLHFMQMLWRQLRPSLIGLFRPQRFATEIAFFARRHGVGFKTDIFGIYPWQRRHRRRFRRLVQFIQLGLAQDLPLAMLLYTRGQVREIQGQHWVTVVGIRPNADMSQAQLLVLDHGQAREFSLDCWFYTAQGGGAFVRLTQPQAFADPESKR